MYAALLTMQEGISFEVVAQVPMPSIDPLQPRRSFEDAKWSYKRELRKRQALLDEATP